MRLSFSFHWRHPLFIMTAALLLIALSSCQQSMEADSSADSETYITTAANGEKIPHPTSTETYPVQDGSGTIQVPEGMVYIPAGSFKMGVIYVTGHTVNLSGYCIGKYMVTNAEYKVFCDEMGSNYRSGNWPATDAELEAFMAEKANHPVLGVNYTNAMAYCAWVSSKTGRNVTLPSEAQWERAARGATTDATQYTYPWGNKISYDDYRTHLNYIMNVAVKYGEPKKEAAYGNTSYDVYWPFVVDRETGKVINQMEIAHGVDDETTTDIVENSPEATAVWDKVQAERGCTTAVGSFSPSPAGCYDMAGNAFEWTRDWFTASYYIALAESMTDPVVEDESVLTREDRLAPAAYIRGGADVEAATKVVRGGSWYAHKESSQTTYRTSALPGREGNVQGFRVVMPNPAR